MNKDNSDKDVFGGKTVTRRDFLKTTVAASAAFTIIPSVAMGKRLGHQAPSDTLNVALIGAGRQGSGDIRHVCKVEVVVYKVKRCSNSGTGYHAVGSRATDVAVALL